MTPNWKGPPSALEFAPFRNLHRHGPNRLFAKLERNRIFSKPVSIKLAQKCVSTTPVQTWNTCRNHPRRRSAPKCQEKAPPRPPKRRPELCRNNPDPPISGRLCHEAWPRAWPFWPESGQVNVNSHLSEQGVSAWHPSYRALYKVKDR